MSFYLQRLPETDDELWWVVRAMWGTTIPRTPVCPEHCTPFQAFADAYFERNSVDPDSPVQDMALWHGSRGLSGKSFMLAVLGLTKAVLKGADVNLLGGSFEQSKNIHIHMRNIWDYDNAPRYMLNSESNTKVELSNDGVIRPLTASQRTVRGPHPPFLLLDEIDEMDIEILDAALGQPLPQYNKKLQWINEPYTVMCSTWQRPAGTMTEIMRRAEERRIPVYRWCYREAANPVDGWLTQKAIDGKKAAIPKVMWETEYELNEPSIGTRAFDSEAVERAYSLPNEPIFVKEKKDFEEYRFEEPARDGKYVAGADWAKEQDYTVIAVGRIDKTPHELVYYARFNRLPYPIMIDYFNKAINDYNAHPIHDGTGLGNVIQDHLDERAQKFLMVGEARSRMLSEYVNAIESDKWRYPKALKTPYIETKYCEVGDLYHGHTKDYHLPDTVCAFALMEYQARRFAPYVGPQVLPKTIDTNRYAKAFEVPQREGEVSQKSEETSSWSLVV